MTISEITADHAGCTVSVTAPGYTTSDLTTWSLFDGDLVITTEALLRDGGSLGEYNPTEQTASVTFRGTVSNTAERLTVGESRPGIRVVNAGMTSATLLTPAAPPEPVHTHVLIPAGIYTCSVHPVTDSTSTDRSHYFLVDECGSGVPGVAQLNGVSGHGQIAQRRSFASYPDCRPVEAATHSVLFGTRRQVRVEVTPDQFQYATRVPAVAEPEPF